MPILKPNYYDNFTCIAGECPFTCCQEWNISVDDDTLIQWHRRKMTQNTKKNDHCHVIALNSQKRCPYLNGQNLCDLVIAEGDELLPETCTTFPRQFHEFDDRTEYSLVLCCPHVVDLLKDKPSFALSIVNAEVTSPLVNTTFDDYFNLRSTMIELILDSQYSVPKGLLLTYYDLHNKANGLHTDFSGLSKSFDRMEFSMHDTFLETNELFLDLIENYRKEARYEPYLNDISMLADTLDSSTDSKWISYNWNHFSPYLKPYDTLFRNCLAAELFTNSLLPDSDLEDLILMMQWIGMEYSVIRHALFLHWIKDDSQPLTYETVRDTIVLFSRIMGYDQEDIYEYLEHSFEDMIWDWGYFALIVGK